MCSRKLVVVIFWIICGLGLSHVSAASEPCDPGEKRLRDSDACIPTQLFNYLYCLQNSGNGKLEVTKADSSNQRQTLEIKVNGQASGVILKGGGAVGVTKEDVANAASQLQEKLDPNLAGTCKLLSDQIISAATERKPLQEQITPRGETQSRFPVLVPDSNKTPGLGMDLDGWCRKQGYRTVGNVDGTGNGWRCVPGEVRIDMNRVCHDQFGEEYSASLRAPGGQNDLVCRTRSK